jgi:hypothetical protein
MKALHPVLDAASIYNQNTQTKWDTSRLKNLSKLRNAKQRFLPELEWFVHVWAQ